MLINAFGIVCQGDAESTTEIEFTAVMDTNVTAVWRTCALFMPLMKKKRSGSIVNISSDWGLMGGPRAVAYCASKGAVCNMTRAMAIDSGECTS